MIDERLLKLKWQATDWEKIFTKYIFDEGLLFKVYKETPGILSTPGIPGMWEAWVEGSWS
jgi:hypothetical protein